MVQAAFGNVPDKLDTTFAVAGNTQLLTTALLNLLDNACKYSAAEVRATLGYTDPKTVQVAVADTGIGMAPNDLARVFEPLYRVENGRQ